MARRRRGELTGTSLDNRAAGSDIVGGDATVAAYQQQLIILGYLPAGSADGVLGPKTTAAVKAFQKDAGLTVDGKVGNNTTAALVAAVATKQMGGGATSSFVQSSSSSAQNPAGVLGQISQAIPSGTTVMIPGIGPVSVPSIPGVPTATPGGGAPGGGAPGTTSPNVSPSIPGGTTAAPATTSADDKIFGIPKNVAIGGGIALGVLALLGLYMAMSKDKSESQSEEGSKKILRYTDEFGQRWVMDDMDNVFPAGFESGSLSQRVRRLHAHPKHR